MVVVEGALPVGRVVGPGDERSPAPCDREESIGCGSETKLSWNWWPMIVAPASTTMSRR